MIKYNCNKGFVMTDQSTSTYICRNGNYSPKFDESVLKCKPKGEYICKIDFE